MIQFIPIRTNHTSYPFVEQLMLDSFPLTERRTEKDQREVTDNEPRFKCMLITDGTLEIGLITLWQVYSVKSYTNKKRVSPKAHPPMLKLKSIRSCLS